MKPTRRDVAENEIGVQINEQFHGEQVRYVWVFAPLYPHVSTLESLY